MYLFYFRKTIYYLYYLEVTLYKDIMLIIKNKIKAIVKGEKSGIYLFEYFLFYINFR